MSARKSPKPEAIFFNTIYTLINNLLIKNKNYSNGHYYRNDKYNMDGIEFKQDTIERANYILEKMDEMRHLLKDDENET